MEFKKLSDVESVEAVSESAYVLIEEDGAIKKAPKSQIGGAGNESIIITVTMDVAYDEDGEPYMGEKGTCDLSTDDAKLIFDAVANGKLPDVVLRVPWSAGDDIVYYNMLPYMLQGASDHGLLRFMYNTSWDITVYIRDDYTVAVSRTHNQPGLY